MLKLLACASFTHNTMSEGVEQNRALNLPCELSGRGALGLSNEARYDFAYVLAITSGAVLGRSRASTLR